MLSFLLSLVVLSPSPAVTATPGALYTPPPGWTTSPNSNLGVLADFTRREPDGTDATIQLQIQDCVCTPEHMADLLASRLSQLPAAHVSRISGTACNQRSYSVIVTGLENDPTINKNIVFSFFRSGNKLYTQTYTYRAATPKIDAINSMLALCPVPITRVVE